MSKPHLLSLSRETLEETLAAWGQKAFRARQLWDWLHHRHVPTFDAMSNLSKTLREKLAEDFVLRALEQETCLTSRDGLTEKWLYAAPGECTASVETVLIREKRLTRRTVCVSTMSGCPVGCAFCATGQDGFDRNLEVGEILEQVYRVEEHCHATETIDGERAISHIVFMGMGEPLLNLDAVLEAAGTLQHESGLNLSNRHITISTVGIPSGIHRLAELGSPYRLAVSLHTVDQALRQTLIPAVRQWPLAALRESILDFSEKASRAVTFEYTLIDKINDSKKDARRLAEWIGPIPAKVNLIPLNKTTSFEGDPPPPDKVRAFQEALGRHGVSATVRVAKGQDIEAACGQLRARHRVKGP